MNSVCEERFPDNACAEDIVVNSQSFNAVNTVLTAPIPVIRVPVLVANAVVNQPIRDSICIPERFYSIKAVSRRPVITQCYVVVNPGTPPAPPTTGTLYVEGYILKNVQYATPITTTPTPPPPCCEEEECLAIRNDYNDLTAKIRFDFAVPVTLVGVVQVAPSTVNERAIFKDCHKQCDSGTISESDCEKLFSQNVALQEPFTCKLNSYSINEALISKVTCENDEDNNLFDTIVEKLNLTLNISIYQLQNRVAPAIPGI